MLASSAALWLPCNTRRHCRWDRLDDVIMGGKSESKLEVSEEGIASWKGTLRVEGGGFCGVRSKVTLVLTQLLANVSTDKKNMVVDDGLLCEL